MNWIYLFLAGIFEVCWALGMKYSQGFTQVGATIFTIVTYIVSFVLLTLALKSLPVGTAYAIWTSIGIVGTAVFGILFLDESRSIARLFCLFLILAGVVGLKIVGGETS